MANSHHDTANGHQGCRGKAKLLCAEERCHNHIASGFELAIRLHRNAAAQVVQHQRLMRLRQAQFPRDARMLNPGLRRSAGASVMPADQNHIRMRLRHTGRNRPHAHLRHQLHANARMVIRVFQVMDQFSQVFDRINIMMRRRRDQAHSRRRVPHFGNPRINLLPR